MSTSVTPHDHRLPAAFAPGDGGLSAGLSDDDVSEVARLARALPGRWSVERCEDYFGTASVLLVREAEGGDDLAFVLSRFGHGVGLELCRDDRLEPVGAFGGVADAMARVPAAARAPHEAARGGLGRSGTGPAAGAGPIGAPPPGRSGPVPAYVPAPFPPDEAGRLAALHRYRILDTPEEEAFDRLVRLAREVFGVEAAQVSLIDGQRQWVKARAAPPGPAAAREAPRSWSICAHAILREGVLVVPDARRDPCLRANPFVAGEPRLRFYAGAPLRTPDGHNLGTLCVFSPEPRSGFSAGDRRRLRALADMAMSEFELRRVAREAEEARAAAEACAGALRRANAEAAAGRAALEAEMARRARAEAGLREAERLASLGRLAGGVAHHVNNVLQAVAGAAGLLAARPDDPALVGRLAGVVADAACRGASVTRPMLAFARRDALRPEPAGAGALLGGAAELIRCAAGPGVAVGLRPDDSRWPVLCDADGLAGALLNLAANARDAMPGGGALALTTRDVRLDEADVAGQDGAEPGDYVEIAVADTGAGMTPEVLTRAFEPFFTTKPVGAGAGLGLSQVHGFARQSGGFARLESAPGRGTTARIFLPRYKGGPVPVRPAEVGVRADPAPCRRNETRAGAHGTTSVGGEAGGQGEKRREPVT